MTELVTQDRARKRDKTRMVADNVVTANSLATHFGRTREKYHKANSGGGDRAGRRRQI
jgi:hypothetical protein